MSDVQKKLQECAAQEEQAGGEADRVETVIFIVLSELGPCFYIFGSPSMYALLHLHGC